MKINKKKLGFTLVELLVVIAILAVLATVAIIGYSSFINEAHKSNDNSVVTELNHYLKAANPLDEKVPTATDAAEKLEGCGLNIAQLQPSTKDAYYGYNYETKEFVFVEGPLQVSGANIKTFLFAKNQTQVDAIYAAHYSVYLQEGYESTDFNAVYGLDVGKATVGAVTYTNTTSDQKTDGIEVVIRTNSFEATLTIDAASDTVKHYGEAGSLNIIAVANASYHEFGTISQRAQIAEGRLVVESTGKIPLVEVTAVPTAQAPVKIETSKDVVVTVSDEVAASLTLSESTLPNTEIKVSNTEANVTVDAVVEASSVKINGTSATTEDLKSVYKATTVAEIESAPAGSYVMLMNDLGPEDMPYEYMDFGGWGFNNPRYIKLKDITLDLNGFTIESGRITAVDVSGTVEILDSSLDKNGQIIHTGTGNNGNNGNIFNINTYATLIISGGTFTSTQGDGIYVDRRLNSNIIINGGIISAQVYGVVLTPQNGVAYLTINGGTITSQTDYAITGNANNSGTVININGGEISSPNTAIYHPQDGVLNITGGTIYGESAVEMRAGTLTVSGNAVLRGNGSYSCQANGNGHTTTGVALAIAQHTTLKDINVTINGGKFEGAKAVAINNPQENATANVTVTINGGTFSGEIYKNPDNASAWTLTDNR